MNFPSWLLQPLLVSTNSVELCFKAELCELQNDDSVKCMFRFEGTMMWISDEVNVKYPVLSNLARKLLIPFPSSYLVECGFSSVTDILTKKRNSLDITKRGDLRLKLTNLTPDIKSLAEEIQFQPSH